MTAFLNGYKPRDDREVWFFPPAVSLGTVAEAISGTSRLAVGAQNVHWEAKGAFTGEHSVDMVKSAGATAALIGHSERRHVFGETDEETSRKVSAVLAPLFKLKIVQLRPAPAGSASLRLSPPVMLAAT